MTVVCLTDEMVDRYGLRALAGWPGEAGTRSAAFEAVTPTTDKPRRRGFVRARDERIEFRPRARPRFTIHLGYAGLEAIRREISWAAPHGVEMGGFLWAHLRADSRGGPVVIAYVSPPAHDSVHGRTAVRLGDPDSVRAAWPDWLAPSAMIAVGDVHSHPSGDGTPSRSDQETSVWGVRQSGGYPWVSLIATRGEPGLGWMDPSSGAGSPRLTGATGSSASQRRSCSLTDACLGQCSGMTATSGNAAESANPPM